MFDRKLQEILEIRKSVRVNSTVFVYIGPGNSEMLQRIRASADKSCPLIYIYPEAADEQFRKTAEKLPLTIPIKIDSKAADNCMISVINLKPLELMFTADSSLRLKNPEFPGQLNIQLKSMMSGLHHEKIARP